MEGLQKLSLRQKMGGKPLHPSQTIVRSYTPTGFDSGHAVRLLSETNTYLPFRVPQFPHVRFLVDDAPFDAAGRLSAHRYRTHHDPFLSAGPQANRYSLATTSADYKLGALRRS